MDMIFCGTTKIYYREENYYFIFRKFKTEIMAKQKLNKAYKRTN